MGAEASTPGARGVDVSLATTGGKRWWTGVGLGGKLYGLPCNAEHLLIFDPSCFTDPVTFIDTRSVAKGEGKWRSTVALGGKLYGIPDRAEAMLIYDFVSKQVIGIDTRKVAKGPLKWQSAVSLAGKVYGIPLNAEKLLVFDPKVHDSSASRPKSSPSKSDGLSGVETGHVATGKLKWLAGLSLGGKVIGVPCNSDALLVYDPLSHSSVGVPTNYHASGPFKWLCAVAFQGMLYAIPCHADCILIFDPSNNRLSHVDTRAVATGPGKWLSCVVVAQKIYGIPDRASNVLVFDPTTEEVSGIDVSGVCDGTAKWQSAAVLGGKIYAVPYHAHDILVVDPASSTASTIDIRSLGTGNGKWGFGAVLGGSLCGLPWDSPKILVYQPSETKEDLSPLAAKPSAEKDVDVDVEAASDPVEHGYKGTPDISSKLGKVLLQDFVGAWLSEWIYFADPAKPYAVPTMKVDGSPVKFQVHSVMDDPLLGSPARSAVVTAMLPGAQVVYLVFKGSSFMNDFVANASVSPDYTPFDATFQDRTTFIHHGAYHATAQLRVQQWPALQEQLERCVQDGVKQMVITGHSLGGQYALAFMLQVFLDGVKGTSLHPLLQEARCAAFGAPMCYGAAEGSDIRQDLATFIHARTAVYINAGDPAPRLWSELDLEDFMRYAIRWFQGKVSSFSMRILDYAAGGLAQKAQEILKRPDIEKHLLRPAARYVHLSQIRVLAKDFLLWRPLSYGRMNIDEHSLAAGYIPALCASFDPIAAGGLWDENGTSLVDEEGHGIV